MIWRYSSNSGFLRLSGSPAREVSEVTRSQRFLSVVRHKELFPIFFTVAFRDILVETISWVSKARLVCVFERFCDVAKSEDDFAPLPQAKRLWPRISLSDCGQHFSLGETTGGSALQ
jgi:hypothetical protein